jgi:hypothetical protein
MRLLPCHLSNIGCQSKYEPNTDRTVIPRGIRRRSSHSSGVTDYDRRAFLQLPAGAFNLFGDKIFVWKDSLILRGEDLVGENISGEREWVRVDGKRCSNRFLDRRDPNFQSLNDVHLCHFGWPIARVPMRLGADE